MVKARFFTAIAVVFALGLALAARCEAQFIAYSTTPTVVTAQSGGFTAYSGAPGYYYTGHRHHHHWHRHHMRSHGFVREVLVPGAINLLNQQLPNQDQPTGDSGGPSEPPVEWAVPQATFVEQEAADCKAAQGTLAVLVDLRKQFPEFQFKSAAKCDCTAPPIDVDVPPVDGAAPEDIDLPPGVRR
jgi:hypothetical protein